MSIITLECKATNRDPSTTVTERKSISIDYCTSRSSLTETSQVTDPSRGDDDPMQRQSAGHGLQAVVEADERSHDVQTQRLVAHATQQDQIECEGVRDELQYTSSQHGSFSESQVHLNPVGDVRRLRSIARLPDNADQRRDEKQPHAARQQ